MFCTSRTSSFREIIPEVSKWELMIQNNLEQEVLKSIPLEVQKMGPLKNYINNNQTNMSNTESNHIISAETDDSMRSDDDSMERVIAYENRKYQL